MPMTAEQLRKWIKGGYGRGVWLAGQLGIKRQTLNNALNGRWVTGMAAFERRGLEKLIAKREKAEKMMA